MKRSGILNGSLCSALARLGHTDTVVVADAGLPLAWNESEVVDLALVAGTPSFAHVLDALLAEVVVESATAAQEMTAANPGCHSLLAERFVGLALVPHEKLKQQVREARLVVRTGEVTPYANVLLHCGVAF